MVEKEKATQPTYMKALFASMHGKEKVIGPALAPLGIELCGVPDFDTDNFGTFSGEKKRWGTQEDAALAKVKTILSRHNPDNLEYAVSSEGSFGPDPRSGGLTMVNREIVLFYERSSASLYTGEAVSPETNCFSLEHSDEEVLITRAYRAGFPEHGMIISYRPWWSWKRVFHKGIHTEDELRKWVRVGLQKASSVRLEADMRALHNPTRMKIIEQAALDLARILSEKGVGKSFLSH